MKLALKAAWLLSSDDKAVRGHLEAAYVSLADFQDGVGDRPLSVQLPADATPQQVLDTLGPWQRWQPKIQQEEAILLRELADFKRQHSQVPK
jgi:hypothetical protein